MRNCPTFERLLVDSGILLIKYWFSVSAEEQERRFQGRIEDRTKRWKLSPMDLESRNRWDGYSRAKDAMLAHTDIPEARWNIVRADNKRRARLNCIRHLLEQIPYREVALPEVTLPLREEAAGYVRPPYEQQNFIPERYGE
jgi:polyphosphate kinase 2 (PPK2 family)